MYGSLRERLKSEEFGSTFTRARADSGGNALPRQLLSSCNICVGFSEDGTIGYGQEVRWNPWLVGFRDHPRPRVARRRRRHSDDPNGLFWNVPMGIDRLCAGPSGGVDCQGVIAGAVARGSCPFAAGAIGYQYHLLTFRFLRFVGLNRDESPMKEVEH